ncbi:MAG TPA: caspase domain-containing protein, partial [Nordella sp.]|nr:caspase domain-containing protein [Nordella sp.]
MTPLHLARKTQRAISVFLAVILAVALTAAAAQAEEQKTLKGVALVIGQSKYAHITPLPNPANDAREMAKLLTDMGFDGRAVTDRDAGKLSRDLERFVEDAEGADIAFLYYSGHGIEAGGENYLVPVNADEASLGNAGEDLVSLTATIDKLKATVPIVIVLLDACRTNPFPASAQLKATPESPALPMTVSGLGAPRGAAVVEQAPAATENLGTVIGFAAEPGRPALDGAEGGNSPYAAALLRHLSAMKGAELGAVMRMVTEEVYLSTETRQRPWVNESLRRLLYLGVAPDVPEGEDGLITGERRQLLLTIADLPSLERQQVESIAKKDGVPMSALYGVLRALGAKDMPKDPDELEKLLTTQAEILKQMMAERAALNTDDPEIKKMAEAADRAINQGAIVVAREFLDDAVKRVEATADAVDEAEEAVKKKRLADAAIYARRAGVAFLASDYLAAAKDYAKAYSLAEKWDEDLKWNYKNLEAEALNAQGDEKADNDALRKSIAAYEQVLS